MRLGPGVRIDRAKLFKAMEAKRKEEGASILSVSMSLGLASTNAWENLGRGAGCHADTFVRILHWLGDTDIGPYLVWDDKGDEAW